MSLFYESTKPDQGRCTIKQWLQKSEDLKVKIQARVKENFDKRNVCRWMRYDTALNKAWALYYNNIKLKDRIDTIEVLKAFLEPFLEVIKIEKEQLEFEKNESEQLIQASDSWIKLAIDILATRDKKVQCDNTIDHVTDELKAEIRLCEHFKAKLAKASTAITTCIQNLIKMEVEVQLDLAGKREAIDHDSKCLNFTKKDTGFSFKVDCLADPDSFKTLEEWYEKSHHNILLIERKVEQTAKERSAIWLLRETFKNAYEEQADKTEFEMRKRIYEYNVQKNELQYQILKVDEMLAKTKPELERVERLRGEVRDDLKSAETRASIRYMRSKDEAVFDEPVGGLKDEIKLLRAVDCPVELLTTMIKGLEDEKGYIFNELAERNQALTVDLQGYEQRMALRPGFYPRSILLQKMRPQLHAEAIVP